MRRAAGSVCGWWFEACLLTYTLDCSALTPHGLHEGLSWLAETLRSRDTVCECVIIRCDTSGRLPDGGRLAGPDSSATAQDQATTAASTAAAATSAPNPIDQQLAEWLERDDVDDDDFLSQFDCE